MRYGKAIMLGLAVATASMLGCSSGRSVSTDRSDNSSPSAQSGDEGKIGLQLQLAPGFVLSSINYTITGGALSGRSMTGTVNLDNSSEIQAIIGAIPVGTGYTISLDGRTGAYQCGPAAATFNISGNTTTYTSKIHLQCGTGTTVGSVGISTDNTICAQLTEFTATPGQVNVGSDINLISSSTIPLDAGTRFTYAWAVTNGSTAGTIVNPAAATTTMHCTGDGTIGVRLTVSSHNEDGGVDCENHQDGNVQCGSATFCGDHTCQSNENVCGCTTDCTIANARCGNGCCENAGLGGTESDDPTAAGFCAADCGNLCNHDGTCSGRETVANCPSDCGCNNDGTCNTARGETFAACQTAGTNDCPCNGNGTCDSPRENSTNCPAECQVCVVNGVCDTAGGETAANCAADCSPTRITLRARTNAAGTINCLTCASPTPTTGPCPTGANACESLTDANQVALCNAAFTCELGRASASSGTRSCAAINSNIPDCYCGTDPLDAFYDCSSSGPLTATTGTPGACTAQVQAGFPGLTASALFSAFNDATYPGGKANNLSQCLATNCLSSCMP